MKKTKTRTAAELALIDIQTFEMVLDGEFFVADADKTRPARPSRLEWFRAARDAANKAGAAFHFKQWGEFDSDRIQIGKKAAGRLLDGREWNQFPESQYAVTRV